MELLPEEARGAYNQLHLSTAHPGVYPPYIDAFSPKSPWMELPLAEATYQTMNDNCSDNMGTPEASQGRMKGTDSVQEWENRAIEGAGTGIFPSHSFSEN